LAFLSDLKHLALCMQSLLWDQHPTVISSYTYFVGMVMYWYDLSCRLAPAWEFPYSWEWLYLGYLPTFNHKLPQAYKYGCMFVCAYRATSHWMSKKQTRAWLWSAIQLRIQRWILVSVIHFSSF